MFKSCITFDLDIIKKILEIKKYLEKQLVRYYTQQNGMI